jgi:hypothetical protein
LRRRFRSYAIKIPRFRPVTGFPFTQPAEQFKSRHLRSRDYLNNGPNERRGLSLSIRANPESIFLIRRLSYFTCAACHSLRNTFPQHRVNRGHDRFHIFRVLCITSKHLTSHNTHWTSRQEVTAVYRTPI